MLIVDDERDIREPSVAYLKSYGYEAYGAKNYKEAVKIIKKYKPKVLVLDKHLKDIYDGIDILKKAVKIDPDIKAVMLTMYNDENEKQEMLNYGAKMVKNKVNSITELKEMIEELGKGG